MASGFKLLTAIGNSVIDGDEAGYFYDTSHDMIEDRPNPQDGDVRFQTHTKDVTSKNIPIIAFDVPETNGELDTEKVEGVMVTGVKKIDDTTWRVYAVADYNNTPRIHVFRRFTEAPTSADWGLRVWEPGGATSFTSDVQPLQLDKSSRLKFDLHTTDEDDSGGLILYPDLQSPPYDIEPPYAVISHPLPPATLVDIQNGTWYFLAKVYGHYNILEAKWAVVLTNDQGSKPTYYGYRAFRGTFPVFCYFMKPPG